MNIQFPETDIVSCVFSLKNGTATTSPMQAEDAHRER